MSNNRFLDNINSHGEYFFRLIMKVLRTCKLCMSLEMKTNNYGVLNFQVNMCLNSGWHVKTGKDLNDLKG